ncbi:hypothetical protein QYF36_016635 [Acer negundo]|nr:hypothetical protein QYF36_007604 [Acer negundo]KAK4838816.1 hypothetical protein QYF36_016635 [Acer negundo]
MLVRCNKGDTSGKRLTLFRTLCKAREAQAKDLRQLGAQRMEDAFGHQQRWARRAGTLSTTFMIRVDWTGMTLTQKQNQESRQKLARSGRGFFDPAIPIS